MDIPVIVVAFNGFNSYGMVRSLGEGGIRPIVLLPRDDINFVAKSKWVHQVIYYNEKNEIINGAFDNVDRERNHSIAENEFNPERKLEQWRELYEYDF